MSTLEVFVDRIIKDGRAVVTNNSDASIPLGTLFAHLQLRRVPTHSRVPAEAASAPTEEVSLSVTEIDMYRKPVDEIPRGYGAAIRLKGEGSEKLEDFLSRKTESMYVFLTT
jgi:hypothetical protein